MQTAHPDTWLPASGEVIAERYLIERVVGRGGMGAVVAARHVRLGEPVAVKFLSPELAKDRDNLERFFREATAASRIKSEHVIRVIDVGTTDKGLPYIAMDLLEGEDLGDLIARGPLPIELAVDCVLQAAEGLAEAHSVGIVHRDIKPSNLWLARRADGSPLIKVLDFGISKLAAASDVHVTATNEAFGSPAYMSPEQIRSAKRVDHRTDIWALGVVLYELVGGRLPFDEDNAAAIFAAIIADPPKPLRQRRADVPAALERLIAACLDKDPARRPSLADLSIGLRPYATEAGRIAADRVMRAGAPSVSLVPPASSVPGPWVGIEAMVPVDGDRTIRMTGRSRSALIAFAIAGTVTLAVVFGIVSLVRPARTEHPRASAPDLPSSVPAITAAAPAPSPEAPSAASSGAPASAPLTASAPLPASAPVASVASKDPPVRRVSTRPRSSASAPPPADPLAPAPLPTSESRR